MDLTRFVDAGILAGWIRAGVAAGLGVLITKVPWLSEILGPDTQAAIGAIVATLVVGAWSHIAKS
jgi:hypothetical protein